MFDYPFLRVQVKSQRIISSGNDRLGRYFNGSLDEMRIFNQALSLDQIQSYIDK